MRVLIYGSRSFAATVADLARHCGHDVVGMIDDMRPGPGIVGSLAQAAASFDPPAHGVLLGIGYNDLAARWAAWLRVRAAGFATPSLVHPRAYVADNARLGPGCLVMAHAIVDRCAQLGQACVVWPGACVSHDTEVGSNTYLSPNATLCGAVRVGAHSFIGAAACVVDHGVVPEGGFVKMGSAYTQRAPVNPVKDDDGSGAKRR